jgi:hypothetical protein
MSEREMEEIARSDLCEDQESSQLYNQTWKHKNNTYDGVSKD